MFFFKKKYDFVFSIGEACSCTQALRDAKLQDFSYPFDWLYGADFSKRIDIIVSEFRDFVNQEDLEAVGQTNQDIHNLCDLYYNKRNGITFNHDFLAGKPLFETYENVRAKYDRRVKRLLNNIKAAKKILVVCIETPITNHAYISNQDIETVFKKLADKFPNQKIDLLYLQNSSVLNNKENFIGGIRVVTNYKSKNKNDPDYAPNMKILANIVKKYAFENILDLRIRNLFSK
jgi:hypothetical protein